MAPLPSCLFRWPGASHSIPLDAAQNVHSHVGHRPLVVTWDERGIRAYTYCTDVHDSIQQWFVWLFHFYSALTIPQSTSTSSRRLMWGISSLIFLLGAIPSAGGSP